MLTLLTAASSEFHPITDRAGQARIRGTAWLAFNDRVRLAQETLEKVVR